MTSFWEILKSSKNLKASDAFAELWGKSIADSWDIITITGTLPLTFEAKGSALTDYRIYGTSEGAGVETENLWVKSSWSNSVGDSRNYFNATLLYQNGSTVVKAVGLPIHANGRYSITLNATDTNYNQIRFKHSGAMRDIYIGAIAVNFSKQDTYTITFDVLGFDASVINGMRLENIMLTKGSTAPTSYIPPGYKLPLTVESGAQSQDIPIYIGDSKLLADEYVDFGEQKVYKRAENLFNKNAKDTNYEGADSEPTVYQPYLQPTDPPIPLPALSTYQGENTLSSEETVGEVSVTGKIKEI